MQMLHDVHSNWHLFDPPPSGAGGSSSSSSSSASGGSTNGYSDKAHWETIPMPTESYWAAHGFPAPTDAAVWEAAKVDAMTGKQVLLDHVLRTIHSPGDILSGDIKFRRLKKLVDIELSEKHDGFKPVRNLKTDRAPVCLMGGGESVKGMFSVKTVVKYLKKFGKVADEEMGPHGIVALGSTDENWGWLSTHYLNRTASWEFEFAEPPSPLRLPVDGQVRDIKLFLDHPKLVLLVVNQHNK